MRGRAPHIFLFVWRFFGKRRIVGEPAGDRSGRFMDAALRWIERLRLE
ncbi:MAG: hypothetical protein ACREFU_17910 [Acetobacteraceae bacterium]